MDNLSLDWARQQDASDPLYDYRSYFSLPDGVIYLDGNSLGPLPKTVPARISKTISQEWGVDLITSWNKAGWIDLPQIVGQKIAPLIGAEADNVIVCDSTSVNLFKAISAALAKNPRRKIITEARNFPTDNYIAEGVIKQCSRDHQIITANNADEIESLLDEDVALLMLTEVNYRTGARHNMSDLTRKAHAVGALTLWDLAHSAGAVPVNLSAAGVDFAVGCGYKFLNGGPGAPAFLYASKAHQGCFQQPLSGWFAHQDPFAFSPHYQPDKSIKQYLCGTPPILSLIALDEALSLWQGIDMHAIGKKSAALGDYFIYLMAEKCAGHELQLITPTQSELRGSQIAYTHPFAGYAMISALIDKGVIGDFRAPDILRFGITPLYTSFADIWQAVDIFATILETKSWDQPAYHKRKAVT